MFHKEKVWHRKCAILETLHFFRSFQKSNWTLRDTANELEVSIGLVSEDLKLAHALSKDYSLEKISRNQALKRIK